MLFSIVIAFVSQLENNRSSPALAVLASNAVNRSRFPMWEMVAEGLMSALDSLT